MKLYFALSSGEDNRQILHVTETPNLLASYFYFNKGERLKQLKSFDCFESENFILDSGAFSAFNSNREIDIFAYIDFIKEHKIKQYANLDDIGSPKQTVKNLEIMQKNGLNPKPVFHIGESLDYLEPLIYCDYIALGGMVHSSNLESWLDNVFNYIFKKNNKIKIHGFGMTNPTLILKYPWYSVDSTSWLAPVAFGRFLKWDDQRKKFQTIQSEEILNEQKMFYEKKMPAEFRNFLLKEQVNNFLQFEKFVNEMEQKNNFNYITNQTTLF